MMSSRMARSTLLRHIGSRLFSSAAAGESAYTSLLSAGPASPAPSRPAAPVLLRRFPVRMGSTVASPTPGGEQQEDKGEAFRRREGGQHRPPSERKAISSYWSIEPSIITKEDGTPWRWSSFMPWEAYKADTSIDVKKHHIPATLLDKIAYWTVQTLRVPSDMFFQRRHAYHAMLLETVAAVPGMVGGMLLHLRSLRRFEHSGGWIRVLLEEAENERMHLMTFMEVLQPRWYERALVVAVQGVFFNAYFLSYLVSPKFAHRVVGYLEEEAVHSYTTYLNDLEAGEVDNIPAPAIAVDYWCLPPNATLKDVVTVVRADEARHRDVNHFASDIHYQGMELKDTPAPRGH